MKREIFKNASLRLTATYLFVVMTVSLVFSFTLYRVLSQDIEKNYRQSIGVIDRFNAFGMRPDNRQRMMYEQERRDARDDSLRRIVNELLLINLAILVFGGGLCYILARRTLQPIEEAHDALQRFTSDAAHELRTPLTTMRTEIEVALMNDDLTNKQAKELLTSNLEEVDRLTVLSERLLLLARLDESELPMHTTAIGTILQDAVQAVQARYDAKKQTLDYTATKKDQLSVIADRASLSELFVVLLDNASKYSQQKTTVKLKTDHRGDILLIHVIDQGRGIAQKDVPHIFERFYRADSSRTHGEEHGYGLGLSLAKKIAAMHNGSIMVASKEGKGSTFTVTLPVAS